MSVGHVILPLYIYPSPVTWGPIYNNIAMNPTLNFSIIVNQNSGPNTCPGLAPGKTCYPVSDYVIGIDTLHSYPNVQVFGYVDTAYATTPLAKIQNQIDTYKNYTHYNADNPKLPKKNIHVDGIFFDDCVSDAVPAHYSYMQSVSAYAKKSLGPGFQHVIFNPGAPPAVQYFNYADEIIVFESYYNFGPFPYSDSTIQQIPQKYWPQSTFLIHHFNGSLARMNQIVENLIGNGIQGLYISTSGNKPYGWTDPGSGIYEYISNYWGQFCDDMW